jgi:leucyl-tRNA synthetase
MLGAEGMDDPDWRAENVADVQTKLESLLSFAGGIIAGAQNTEESTLDRWLLSKLQRRIADTTSSLEELKTRSALQAALFDTWNDIRYYIQRRGKTDSAALREAVKVWLRLLAPFAPYVCEELWSQTGEGGFVSTAQWPKVDPCKVDAAAEEQENYIADLIGDTLNILRATKMTAKRIYFYTASAWKWQVYLKVLDKAATGEVKMNDVMREIAADASLKPHIKEVAALVPRMTKALTKLSSERKANMFKIKTADEKAIIQGALNFLHERFNSEVTVYDEEDKERYDPKQRAAMAMPNQPAIYIE